jgi:ribonuclease III
MHLPRRRRRLPIRLHPAVEETNRPMPSQCAPQLQSLEQAIGHLFRLPELLQRALTHSSDAWEREMLRPAAGERPADNEQLEFLGDAVLGLVTTEELFRRFPQFSEGQLSKLRAHLVSKNHLIHAAERLDLGRYLRLGRGEEKSGGRTKAALLVDALEAILGAVYLDAGLEAARELILKRIVLPELELFVRSGRAARVTDFKSALQESLQACGRPQPVYVLVEEAGPEHRKTFTMEARLVSLTGAEIEFVGRAQGPTKKTAEQQAARQVLDYLAAKRVGAMELHGEPGS